MRDEVMARSGGHCEAMIRLQSTWTRCGRSPVDDHHVLPAGRGGRILDDLGETYHHLALCRAHHREVDERGEQSGLLIQGYVYRDGINVVYSGKDEYLLSKYGKESYALR